MRCQQQLASGYAQAGWLLFCLLLTALWPTHALAQRTEHMRSVLSKEVRFTKYDKVALRDSEPCPSWIDVTDIPSCRRLDVVYRDVYLSGILVEHPNPTATLAIYHSGHEAARTVNAALREAPLDMVREDAAWLVSQIFNRGANVLILSMPGLGLTPEDESESVRKLYSILENHNAFALLDLKGDSALAYFVAHIRGFLNRFGTPFRNVIMVGRSGGGWTTSIAAALDRRIRCSVAFFGSLPLQLRLPLDGDNRYELGDLEQYGLTIYQQLDYPDFYALASTSGRRHTVVYNEKDDCCFSGAIKGRMVMPLFEKLYPNHSGFSIKILPHRSESDHSNLDVNALNLIEQTCDLRHPDEG